MLSFLTLVLYSERTPTIKRGNNFVNKPKYADRKKERKDAPAIDLNINRDADP